MRDAHLPLDESGTSRDLRSRAMQEHRWFPGGVVANLDVPPTDRADAGTERLRRRLLGGEPDGERRGAPGGVGTLARSVHPREESLAVTRDRRSNTRDFDDIHTDREARIGRGNERVRALSAQRRRR